MFSAVSSDRLYLFVCPKSVQIAVCVNRFYLFLGAAEIEAGLGLIRRSQHDALDGAAGLQHDKLDIVRLSHRVHSRADGDKDFAILDLDDRNMLFDRSVSRVGRKLRHGLAATDKRAAAIDDFFHNVATGIAAIE